LLVILKWPFWGFNVFGGKVGARFVGAPKIALSPKGLEGLGPPQGQKALCRS
jgi:hypothetical protein